MSKRQVELPSRDEVRVAIAGVLGWNIDSAPEWPEQVRDEHNALLKVGRAYERGQLQEASGVGERVEWCEEHAVSTPHGKRYCWLKVIDRNLGEEETPCRIVSRLLIPPTDQRMANSIEDVPPDPRRYEDTP